jgi:Mn2+/Fe2+ NRAMP family transporter
MGEFANGRVTVVLAWITAATIVCLNVKYLLDICGLTDWFMKLIR